MIIPVILAGGSGSRLWPLSRSAYPKQLLPLVCGRTLLQETVLRALSIPSVHLPIIVCNHEHRFLVSEQLKQVGVENALIILEPFGKNTAPAVTIAAMLAKKQVSPEALLMILPADHLIPDTNAFINAISVAENNAHAGHMVTFGIKPTQPETGYGYIKTDASHQENSACKVLEFVEKPNVETAKQYIVSNQYYWNSGMFMVSVLPFLRELERHAEDVFKTCNKTFENVTKDLEFYRLNKTLFAECPNISLDYAVMEKTDNAVLIPLNTPWSDVGSWLALWEVQQANQDGNVIQGDVILEQTSNSYLRAESRMLAVVGVQDHIVVETPDAVLVAHKNYSQAVKEIVGQLKQKQRSETDLHKKVYRPWGYYETIDKSNCFQVKRITVKPGASLSLQMHLHRSEHWVVVSGTAEVTRQDEVFIISANESTYIPKGVKHRLANPGTENLEIIEVQSGTYLGEDDIVRFDDVYGRVEEYSV